MLTSREEGDVLDLLVKNLQPRACSRSDLLQKALRSIRLHLEMDVAFISQFSDERRTFRYVDCDRALDGISVGISVPLEETYCKRVLSGELPFMSAQADPNSVPPDAAISKALTVGSYVTVPVRLGDGSIYGTLCAARSAPCHSLNERDLKMMNAFAEMAAQQIEVDLKELRMHRELKARVQSVLDHDQLTVVYQPIVDIFDDVVVGYESLSRFSAQPFRTPDVWFAEAAQVGLDVALEVAAIGKALTALCAYGPPVYASFNASPSLLISGELGRLLDNVPLERVVVEVTEHATIHDYESIRRACRTLRDRGMRLAVDDAGAGFASFRHILSLAPDFIKLDMSLTRDIDKDSGRQALAAALIAFATKTGSEIIAEGVENAAELEMLRSLGVRKAQGYLLGRPAPLPGVR